MEPRATTQVPSSERVTEILGQYNDDTLSLLHYFRKSREGAKVRPLYLGDFIQRKYHEVKPFLQTNLIGEVTASTSCIFFREKIEDFIFRTCEERVGEALEKATAWETSLLHRYNEVQSVAIPAPDTGITSAAPPDLALAEKKAQLIEEYLATAKKATPVISRLKRQADKLKRLKVAFAHLLQVVKDVPANRRIADPDHVIRDRLLHVLGSFDPDTQAMREQVNVEDAKTLLGELEALGFWREYSPAKRYFLTDLGVAVAQELMRRQNEVKSEEEQEFDALMKRIQLR